MRSTLQFELFKREFLHFYEDYIIVADFDCNGNLMVLTNPYYDFNHVVLHICRSILDVVHFHLQIRVDLQPFGANEYVRLSIN